MSIKLRCNVCSVQRTVNHSFPTCTQTASLFFCIDWWLHLTAFDKTVMSSSSISIQQTRKGFVCLVRKKCTFRTLNVTDEVNILVLQWGHLVAQIVYNKRNCWNLPQIGTLHIGERWKHVCRCTPSLECYYSHSVSLLPQRIFAFQTTGRHAWLLQNVPGWSKWFEDLIKCDCWTDPRPQQ